MERGKVRRFNNSTGAGEIKSDNDNRIIKFNKKVIEGDIKQIADGAIVEYEEFENRYNEAKRVIVVTPAPSAASSHSMTTIPIFQPMPKSKSPSVNSHKNFSPPKKKQNGGTSKSPYGFIKRDSSKNRKIPPEQFHDILKEGCYDIAFEIEWETLTPTAANPCVDSKVGGSPAGCKEREYAGYNKRWLMIDNKLAISPFTVKSAIANGFANLLGGCYRVNTKEEGHSDIGKGKYLYGGRYKRYRVAMDGSSRPGIVTDIQIDVSGDKIIKVVPVKEFYCDTLNIPQLKQGAEVSVKIVKDRGQHKPPIIEISQGG